MPKNRKQKIFFEETLSILKYYKKKKKIAISDISLKMIEKWDLCF